MTAREVVLAQYVWEEREAARAARVAAIEAGGETVIGLADQNEEASRMSADRHEVEQYDASLYRRALEWLAHEGASLQAIKEHRIEPNPFEARRLMYTALSVAWGERSVEKLIAETVQDTSQNEEVNSDGDSRS